MVTARIKVEQGLHSKEKERRQSKKKERKKERKRERKRNRYYRTNE